MYIPLRVDWESKIIDKLKMYFLNIKDKVIVDEIFNKLQIQERLKYITQFTSFCFFVFVMHKILFDGIDNNRFVINIRKFN